MIGILSWELGKRECCEELVLVLGLDILSGEYKKRSACGKCWNEKEVDNESVEIEKR